MNILFKPMFVRRILNGRKTVTRRRKEPRYKPGDIVLAKAGYREKPFARLRIIGVTHEENPLYRCVYWREANREGCDSWQHFMDIYALINGVQALDEPCYRIEFEVVPEATK